MGEDSLLEASTILLSICLYDHSDLSTLESTFTYEQDFSSNECLPFCDFIVISFWRFDSGITFGNPLLLVR